MIFFAALNLAVIFSYFTKERKELSYQSWLILFFFYFLGFWSGFEFWSRAYWAVFG